MREVGQSLHRPVEVGGAGVTSIFPWKPGCNSWAARVSRHKRWHRRREFIDAKIESSCVMTFDISGCHVTMKETCVSSAYDLEVAVVSGQELASLAAVTVCWWSAVLTVRLWVMCLCEQQSLWYDGHLIYCFGVGCSLTFLLRVSFTFTPSLEPFLINKM